ncbi:hypothetical protein FOCG_03921 [Fusarium oxysporum f. sp. radicis-lycopersici 26381]|uniref:Uncharacterized protein n=4 Tax=Fusarium oxysporum species complex TaxID=171631 RepID=W9I6A8_FUSOX|nr:uncharacterized protein FOIG_09303 [Fusarium odoratissimum NRRL 54006]EWY90177.1 hypothetical protein FOYG_07784 [Fusarium oxysporum NRRL 32931]EWZ36780.1 hypothetical protein FOZG_10740 [Fusarium oxysporum Fo47]EWZ90559.1 hypothetical protein FOWG_08168 [Fusarium oxysporum f. sp. lycopersici MN25]EXL56243.1 hypothetical protein FOCG_03921 [Fusarium oxysporum f. sp. radicis-lycopersici 26381]KAJ0139316.1 Uncharacterized protein HZ326_17731 [Fusarium oxysporum f. sp. albedinis]TXC00704.1 hy
MPALNQKIWGNVTQVMADENKTSPVFTTVEHMTPVMLFWEGISGVVSFVRWTAATADKAWGELGLV